MAILECVNRCQTSGVNGVNMEEKAQVSLEYLLTVLFSVVLAMIAAVVAINVTQIATVAQSKVLLYRENAIAALLGG